jgi:ATPase subunit of ABC transporter with duplicated ATPase domains
MRGVGKAFPGVVALDNVTLTVGHGEVVALCGENGAGKSTLMKILSGYQPADGGEIRFDGQLVDYRTPQAALRAALAGVRDVVVLDRNHSPGTGGILHQELKAALYGTDDAPRVHGLLAGVGGVNVPPQRIAAFVRAALERGPANESQWVR